ncbi:hypothetical protein Leryth_005747 [Lithospermum erythrorhizon]|nr:hypothetical protein Leryth_005747 [Lithospermum erythrorhizon]
MVENWNKVQEQFLKHSAWHSLRFMLFLIWNFNKSGNFVLETRRKVSFPLCKQSDDESLLSHPLDQFCDFHSCSDFGTNLSRHLQIGVCFSVIRISDIEHLGSVRGICYPPESLIAYHDQTIEANSIPGATPESLYSISDDF